MKTIKYFLIAILVLVSFAGTCEPEEVPQANEDCNCHIKGTKLISFDNGLTWQYNGMDERTDLILPCYYDNIDTSQRSYDGVMYKTHWECKD